MDPNIQGDFQICISVPLRKPDLLLLLVNFNKLLRLLYYLFFSTLHLSCQYYFENKQNQKFSDIGHLCLTTAFGTFSLIGLVSQYGGV